MVENTGVSAELIPEGRDGSGRTGRVWVGRESGDQSVMVCLMERTEP